MVLGSVGQVVDRTPGPSVQWTSQLVPSHLCFTSLGDESGSSRLALPPVSSGSTGRTGPSSRRRSQQSEQSGRLRTAPGDCDATCLAPQT